MGITADADPTHTAGPYLLRMRGGGVQQVRLAQAPPPSQPTDGKAASRPSTSRPAEPLASSQPFGAEVLTRAHARWKKPPQETKRAPSKPEAAQLAVDLPPRGATLKSRRLTLRGRTHPSNRVTVNGAAVSLAEDGTFVHTAELPDGKSEILIRSVDRSGNVGSIRWPVEVSDRELFLMAMAEGAIGQVGAELDGDTDHSRLDTGPVMLRGRAVLYLKGRIKGKYLFKQYFVTAHVDTAKQREFQDFFDQVIDPNRFYPVYGDSAREIRDVNARDKYYLLIKADRSSAVMGNFTAGVKGIELLKYDRDAVRPEGGSGQNILRRQAAPAGQGLRQSRRRAAVPGSQRGAGHRRLDLLPAPRGDLAGQRADQHGGP